MIPVFILASLILLAGCGGKSYQTGIVTADELRARSEETGNESEAKATSIFEDINDRAFDLFVTGLMNESVGNYTAASYNYRDALKYYPRSTELNLSYGRMLYFMGRSKEALTALQNAEHENGELLSLAARCYHSLGMADSVRATYLRLIKIQPDNTLAYSFLAGYYRQAQDLDSTIWAYEQLTRLRPTGYRQLNELAGLIGQRGETVRARELLRQSLQIEPGSANIMAITTIGELYLVDGAEDSAVAAFEEGLEIDPYNLLLHRELASLYVRAGELYSALDHARMVSELSPLDRAASRRLGILYFSVDSLSQADSVFTALVASGDRNPINHFYLGRMAALSDDWERARDEFTTVTQLADTLARSWIDLGQVYRRLEQRDKEIETYRTGLGHMRDEASAIDLSFALGAAYEQSGQIGEAVATFEEIIAHDPNHAPSLNYLGYMLADRGERLEYARELIGRALEISPDNAAFLDSYGWVFFRLGQYDKALEYLEKAVTLDIDPVIFDHLGDTHEALGNMEVAREWWEKALEQQPDNEAIKVKLSR